MRRNTIRLLTAGLAAVFLLTACRNNDTVSPEAEPTAAAEATPVPTAEAEPTEEPEPTEVPAPTEVPVEDSGMVEVKYATQMALPDNEAFAFTKDMKVGWNLGNCFDAHDSGCADEMDYETVWCGAKVTKELIHTMKEAGFKTIRVPVSWHNHVDGNNNISEKWMNRVEEVIGWICDEDMYAIINIHHDNDDAFYPSYDKLDKSKKYVTAIWKQVAERFADYDEHVIFETLNEPRQVGTDHEWWIDDKTADYAKEAFDCVNQLNQAAVDAIRANGKGHNPDRYILVPGYCAAPEFETYDDFKIPNDSAENRIIISAHAYTPYNFALNISGTDKFSIKGGNGTGDIDYFIKSLHRSFISKGIPVVITEWGSLDKNNLESRLDFTAYYVATAAHYGIPTVLWDNNAYKSSGENFGIIDRATLEWRFPEIKDQLIYSATSTWGE
ncbi:MAG: glycoside hydrolase family 5 protein [Lachnospiraceae bacterium]|nr:glycoside hydrolase family 5 protein [Lachnospiraceae bacterium]